MIKDPPQTRKEAQNSCVEGLQLLASNFFLASQKASSPNMQNGAQIPIQFLSAEWPLAGYLFVLSKCNQPQNTKPATNINPISFCKGQKPLAGYIYFFLLQLIQHQYTQPSTIFKNISFCGGLQPLAIYVFVLSKCIQPK